MHNATIGRYYPRIEDRERYLRSERLSQWKKNALLFGKQKQGLNLQQQARKRRRAFFVRATTKNKRRYQRQISTLALPSTTDQSLLPYSTCPAFLGDKSPSVVARSYLSFNAVPTNINVKLTIDEHLDQLGRKEELAKSGFLHHSLSAVSNLNAKMPKQESQNDDESHAKEFMEAIAKKIQQHNTENSKEKTSATKIDLGVFNKFDENNVISRNDNLISHGDNQANLNILEEKSKYKKILKKIDHAKAGYQRFRKNFYIAAVDLTSTSPLDIENLRNNMNIKVKGKDCPCPILTWNQAGLSDCMMQTLVANNFSKPFAIQKQAIPAIMKGRDVIGIAKTGSGKTLAFLLPLFRHVEDQNLCMHGEGPIGLIMAPARELVVQIYKQALTLAKHTSVRVTCIYGGASIKEQISSLKRGCEIAVGTPGRLIDVLSMNSGRLMSLKRVTYVVLDEADRMFDLGFEPQISSILDNIRPDRQTLLFSATFPQKVEILARQVLKSPIEISLGGRSVASDTIKQIVEVLDDEKSRFLRLLQILGLWYSKGKNILIFVDTQKRCDDLFHKLGKCGYQVLSLHGGKEQIDRDCTIKDFNSKVRTVMVATSVAGRGLDVNDLALVINFSCPNHMEDYVHRIGRTGRAGTAGTAYTFITPRDEKYAHDIGKALRKSKVPIPPKLETMICRFNQKVKRGEATYKLNQYSTVKGYTFDAAEMTEQQRRSKMDRFQFMNESGIALTKEDRDEIEQQHKMILGFVGTKSLNADINRTKSVIETSTKPDITDSRLLKAIKVAESISKTNAVVEAVMNEKQQYSGSGSKGQYLKEEFEAKIDISEYPREVVKVMLDKKTRIKISDLTDGATFTARGMFVPDRKKLPVGEEPLHLIIEADTEIKVKACVIEVNRLIHQTMLKSYGGGSSSVGKYSDYGLL
eukprot:g8084.t1